jgi:hypothetical protein
MSEQEYEMNELESDPETALAAKLAAVRKAKEAKEKEEAALEESAADQSSEAKTTSSEDTKELMYDQLEKMGCTRSYLSKMKERHGTIVVYPHEDERWFVIRPLKVKEMRMIKEIVGQDMEKLNKEILESAVVFPKLSEELVNELPAGLPDVLVNMISRLSAFIPVELAFSLSKEL